jgi:hypothetical protein
MLFHGLKDPLQKWLFEKKVQKGSLPGIYWFLLFPQGTVPVFASKEIAGSRVIASLSRAVSADWGELQAGVIGVNVTEQQHGFSRLEDFRFLPDQEGPSQIEGMRRFLQRRRLDVEFSQEPEAGGKQLVRFEHFDHGHARSFIFRYRTDGKNVEPLSLQINSGVLLGLFWGSFFITSIILRSLFEFILQRHEPVSC